MAKIAAGFVENFDPKGERCWIAEMGGQVVGSAFLIGKSRAVAKLRLLILDPRARGLGKRLVGECVRCARRAGYKKVTLWTNDGCAPRTLTFLMCVVCGGLRAVVACHRRR